MSKSREPHLEELERRAEALERQYKQLAEAIAQGKATHLAPWMSER